MYYLYDTDHEVINKMIGKTITKVSIDNDQMTILFKDGSGLSFQDNGQNCCEYRYMNSDDDLPYFTGATFLGATVEECKEELPSRDEVTECAFLIVKTSNGSFTVANYNQHNGYYGGFSLTFKEL